MTDYYYVEHTKNGVPQEWKDSIKDVKEFLQKNWECRKAFYEDEEDADSLQGEQKYLTFLDDGIRSNNYVGTVIFNGARINIFPKVFGKSEGEKYESILAKNLCRWITYCNKSDYPFLKIDSEVEENDSLLELFVALYVKTLRKAFERSPFFQYEEREEDCFVIKGRFDTRDYFLSKLPNGALDRFHCRFSEFNFDNKLNRTIKYVCKRMFLVVKNGNNKKVLHDLLFKLEDVTDEICTPYDCEKIHLSKSYRHYEDVLTISKIFLLNSFGSTNPAEMQSFCFLFPMEKLFEGFMAGFMTEHYGKAICPQCEKKLFADEDCLIKIKPDLLYESGSNKIVLDTKYKLLDKSNATPSNSDIYQILIYAEKYGTSKAYLLYPKCRNDEKETDEVKHYCPAEHGRKVNLHVVKLPFIYEGDEEQADKKLKDAISNIFESETVI